MNCQGPTSKRRARKARARRSLYGRVCRKVDKRDGPYCRVCLWPLIASAEHHHIIPRSLGGPHTTENVCLICRPCHLLIHAKRITVTGNADGQLQIVRAA